MKDGLDVVFWGNHDFIHHHVDHFISAEDAIGYETIKLYVTDNKTR